MCVVPWDSLIVVPEELSNYTAVEEYFVFWNKRHFRRQRKISNEWDERKPRMVFFPKGATNWSHLSRAIHRAIHWKQPLPEQLPPNCTKCLRLILGKTKQNKKNPQSIHRWTLQRRKQTNKNHCVCVCIKITEIAHRVKVPPIWVQYVGTTWCMKRTHDCK